MFEAIFAAVGIILIFFLAVTIVAGIALTYFYDPDAPLSRDDDEEQAEYIRRWHRRHNKKNK